MKKLFDRYPIRLRHGNLYQQTCELPQNGYIDSCNLTKLQEQTDIYTINWGTKNAHSRKGCAIETGFFYDSLHADNFGLYEICSLNFNGIRETVEKYQAKISAKQFQTEGKLTSKFNQSRTSERWSKVILMCQHPKDRSIRRAGYDDKQYFEFVDQACKFYGKNLLLKLHPVNGPEDTRKYQEIAKKYGCETIRCGLEIINECEYVVLFNSTAAVDCFLANKPVLQYAPGYFWKTETVDYSESSFRDPKNLNLEYNEKFCDFLIWKYCFHRNVSPLILNKIFDVYSTSTALYPLPEKLSYANYLLNKETDFNE